MAIRHKRKTTSGYTWQTGDLVEGQIGLNTADGTLHFKKTTGGGGGGGRTAVSISGTATTTTSLKKTGTHSAQFNGSQYLTASSAFMDSIGTGDFTVEGWVYQTGGSTNGLIFTMTTSGNTQFAIGANFDVYYGSGSTGNIQLRIGTGGAGTDISKSGFTQNNWHHIAFVRSSGVIKAYLDGVGSSGVSDSTNINFNITPTLGSYSHALGNNVVSWLGYIDEFRVSNTARYTANFTPNTGLLSNDANTLLLLHMDGNFTDDTSGGVVETIVTLEPAVQGIQGIQGITGITGNQGIQGIQGIDGSTGSAGSQGIQGVQGDWGLQGYQGIQGRQGIIGDQGSQGIQGVQGLDGSTGSSGSQGIQGVQGLDGATGSSGSQGIQGIQGVQGTDANVQGIQGVQGADGAQGTAGFVGSNGSQGIQGIQGATGTNGTIGTNGSQGIQGIQGVQGTDANVQGLQGIQGVSGIAVETVYDLGTTSGTITPNFTNGSVQKITLNGNLTWNAFTSPVAGQTITLIINTNGTSRTLTSTMKFAGGAKTISVTNTTDIITAFYDGTNYYATLAKGFV